MKYGDVNDVKVIKYAVCCGINGIFTAHGSNLNDLKNNPYLNELLESNIFEKIVILDNLEKRGRIKDIINLSSKICTS